MPSPCPPPCGLRGADGAELLHSSLWCTTSAPLRLWKSLQDPVVPHRPQYILGAARESRWLGCGRRPFQTFLVAVGEPWVGNASCAVCPSLRKRGMAPGCTAEASVVPLPSVGNVRVLPSSRQNGQGELLWRSRKGRRMRKAEQFTTPVPHHTPTYIPQSRKGDSENKFQVLRH